MTGTTMLPPRVVRRFRAPPRDGFRAPPRDGFRAPPRDGFRAPPRGTRIALVEG
jgi:hypothetical protein